MIESLTKSQKALLPVYAETWKKIALESKHVDRPLAERLLNEAYTKAGLIPPKRILWFSSKEEMLLYAACIKRNTKHPAFASVSDSVWASVWASAWASVGASVGDSVSDSVRDPVWDSVYWYSDLAFCDYLRNVCGLTEETEKISGFINFAQHCGCFYAMNNFALLCS